MFASAWIDNSAELEEFRDRCTQVLGVRFPLAYFRQGRVRIFRRKDGSIAGGYALILEGPFRTLASIPSDAPPRFSVDEEALVEVTALWMDRSAKVSERCKFWWRFSRDLSSQGGKRFFIFAYEARKTRLGKLYSLARPVVLYKGWTVALEGMPERAVESIEMASCRRIGFLPLYALPNFLWKLLFGSAHWSGFRGVRNA